MKLKIGVMGSATEKLTKKQKELAITLGRVIADNDCILITGACPGLPHLCSKGMKQAGGLSIGISPGHSLQEHVLTYDSPTKHYDVLVYTGSGLMGREIFNIRSSEIIIIIGGRSGTLGEFAIAYDEGKLIGVLEGSGGIADQIDVLIDICKVKETGSKIIKDSDPHSLVKRLITTYKSEFHPRSSIFSDFGNIESRAFRQGKKNKTLKKKV